MPRIPLTDHLRTAPFTVRQGINAGLGVKRLRGRDLQRPFRGVRSPEPGELTLEGLCAAYHQSMPGHAYFCSVTAAALMSIPLPQRHEESRVLHVAVPPSFRTPIGNGIRGHTFVSLPDHVRSWHGIRVSSAEFTWCQLGAVLTFPDLVAAGDYLIHHRLPFTTAERLKEAVAGYTGRRGKPALRAALPLLNDRSESRRESLLRVLVTAAGIQGVAANQWITTSGGYRYRGDLVIREKKVVIEYQSRFHDESKEFRADMTRISRLEADGWFVMQVNNDDLNNPSELTQRIRIVLRGRSLAA